MKKIIIARSIMGGIGGADSIFGRGTMAAYIARTSEEILNIHGVRRADLIITEASLPLMGGVKLCAAIRGDQDLKKVSIIMVCEKNQESWLRAHANAIIAKPIDPIQFFSKISELLVIPERKDLRVTVRASVTGREETSFFDMSRNISISGMLLESDRPIGVGDQFRCSFKLGHSEISAEGRVVRTAEAGGKFMYGMKFLNLDTKSMIIIEQFVKRG